MKKYIVIIAIIVAAISCRKEVPIDVPDKERKIVLNTLVEAGEFFSSSVFRSNHVQDRTSELLYLNNAAVSVFENNVLLEQLTLNNNGYYTGSSARAEIGHQYEFEVTVPNLSSCRARTQVLPEVPIIEVDSIGIVKYDYGDVFDSYQDTYYAFDIKLKDQANTENYYRLKAFFVDEGGYDPNYPDKEYYVSYLSTESNDAAIEVWPDFDGYYYFSDVLFDGDNYNFNLGILPPWGNETQEIGFTLEHISKDFFLYVKSADFQRMNKGDALFSQTVQVLSNIENGFGIVGSTTKSTETVFIKGILE